MLVAQTSINRNSKDIIIEGRCHQLDGNVSLKWDINNGEINDNILTHKLKENIELYWSRNKGDRPLTSPYYFRVE